jgi:hypothetical protein
MKTSDKRVPMKTLLTIVALVPLATSCATPGKSELDAEVKRLCAIDGGIRLYEKVTLASDKFNQYGQINFYRPTHGENALGPEYLFKQETIYYRRGSPEMSRTHYQVIRRVDSKLLGETVFYGRGGGDLPGPWRDSTFVCPSYEEADSMALLMKVFVRTR